MRNDDSLTSQKRVMRVRKLWHHCVRYCDPHSHHGYLWYSSHGSVPCDNDHYLTESLSCRATRTILIYMMLRLSGGGAGQFNYHRADFPSSPSHCLSRCLLFLSQHDRMPQSTTCQLLLSKHFALKETQRSWASVKACTREWLQQQVKK